MMTSDTISPTFILAGRIPIALQIVFKAALSHQQVANIYRKNEVNP